MAAIPGKVDTAKQRQWLEKELNPAIEQAGNGEIHLLFCEAAHFTLSAFVSRVWSRVRVFLKTSHGRNRINVRGAVDAVSKEITTLINTTYITTETIVEFLGQLKEKYTQKPIYIILDNAKYQRCNMVMQKARELAITILFLPPYSPNLNIIERLWKFTKKQILYGKYYDTAEKFHMAIRCFFEKINHYHQSELECLLTLNFQLFDDNMNSQFNAT
jgi:transposase